MYAIRSYYAPVGLEREVQVAGIAELLEGGASIEVRCFEQGDGGVAGGQHEVPEAA